MREYRRQCRYYDHASYHDRAVFPVYGAGVDVRSRGYQYERRAGIDYDERCCFAFYSVGIERAG